MQNIKVTMEEGILKLEIDLSADAVESKSGKSMILASTRGNQTVILPDGSSVKLGVNVYKVN